MSEAPSAGESAATREKILDAACRLFAHQGYENTSLSQVAREAKVSKALIFWHFDTKENLFQIALRKTLEPYFISEARLEGLDEPGQLAQVIDEFYDFVQDNLYSVRFFFSLTVREDKEPGDVMSRIGELYGMFRGLIADIIERGARKGSFRVEGSSELEAALVMASMAGILVNQFLNEKAPYDSRTLLDHLKTATLTRLTARP
jgi:AcrR family transcriptional regulator